MCLPRDSTAITLTILFVFVCCCQSVELSGDEWVVRLPGGQSHAKRLAFETGYKYKGKVRGFKDTYVFTTKLSSDSKRKYKVFISLKDDARVTWAEQQTVKSRQKRTPPQELARFATGKRNYLTVDAADETDQTFNDELWSQEWYLQDTRTGYDLPKLDLNVLPVYKAGITGKGVRVTILDDGLEYTHDDLKNNYAPEISWDCNEDDGDPMPRYDSIKSNSHGTRCAGEVAMSANNGKCGVGVAFNSRIGGVKLLDGFVNDRIEGIALGFAHELVDIYSASWGPNDDGQTVDGPGTLAKEAMERGIREGRGGKGSIYIWASGNGGSKYDNCNCDGYLTSPYTISIGSASQRGEFPWYGEECASTLAVTYSSGAYQDQMIATTDLGNKCTINHTGTSASAPLAAGIVALALEANPRLTWRDVQHLIIWTSEYAPVADDAGWQMNAAGLWFNTRFGFGLMNAHRIVRAAANWSGVPHKYTCTVKSINQSFNNTIVHGVPFVLVFTTKDCLKQGVTINYLEHVEVTVNIDYTVRGSLEIYLTSPAGSRVQILGIRKLDKSTRGFDDWTFMSVMTWGENPNGIWMVEIVDKIGPTFNFGTIGDLFITIHGTRNLPKHMWNGPRRYNDNYNRMRKSDPNYYNSYETLKEMLFLK